MHLAAVLDLYTVGHIAAALSCLVRPAVAVDIAHKRGCHVACSLAVAVAASLAVVIRRLAAAANFVFPPITNSAFLSGPIQASVLSLVSPSRTAASAL